MNTNNIIQAENLSYVYEDNNLEAVKNVSFAVSRGSYVAILGLNGSGKSTLARLLCGIYQPSSGNVKIFSESKAPVGIVFQSPKNQIIASIVKTDTGFGPNNLGFSATETENIVLSSLKTVSLEEKIEDFTANLSLGQTQKLALAGILALNPDLLILDESVSMIDPDSRKEILVFLDRENQKGKTIIHITHDLDEAERANRILVMENGILIRDENSLDKTDSFIKSHFCIDESDAGAGSLTIAFQADFSAKSDSCVQAGSEEVGSPTDVESTVQASSGDLGDAVSWAGSSATALHTVLASSEKSAAEASTQETSLYLKNITFAYPGQNPLYKDFSLSFKKGSLTAIMGKSGGGKSTLFEIASGLLEIQEGEILATERPVLALQEAESALFENFAADDVAFGPINKGLTGKKLKEKVVSSMELTGLDYSLFGNRNTKALSGGEKRRLSLAGIIALDSSILLFDEPTAGLDPQGRKQILKTLEKLSKQGKTVIYSTHREEEAKIANRQLKIENGEILYDSDVDFEKTAKNQVKGEISTEKLVGFQRLEGVSLLKKLNGLSTGLYEKKDSIIHKLSPLAKYLVFLGLFLTSVFLKSIPLSLLSLGVALVYAIFAKLPLKKPLKSFFVLFPWVLFFLILQFLFFPINPGDTILFHFGIIKITVEKILISVKSILHLATGIFLIFGFMYSTDEKDILEGFKKLIPSKSASLILVMIFRFIPLLADEASLIIKVQLVRGGLGDAKGFFNRLRKLLPLFVPLINRTLERANSVAEALTARYF